MSPRVKSIFTPFNLAILAIITLSFFLLSTAFLPGVNSDMTINVLMAHYFKWPDNVYFWGQNRLGSFIPMLAAALMKISGLSAVLAVSICNYAVITLGFIGFSTLFKRKISILLFALLWFFPYNHFLGLNVFPLGLSYGLFGFSIWLYRGIKVDGPRLVTVRNCIFGLAILLALVAAVWISDLMMVTLVILALSSLFRLFFNIENRTRLEYLKVVGLFVSLAIIYIVDLVYLKSLAKVEIKSFGGLNSLQQVGEAFSIVFQSLKELFFFSEINIVSLGAWSLLGFLLLGLTLFTRKFKSYFLFKDFWTSFFFLDFFGILCVIYLSHWVLLNEMGSWYFVAPYISGCIWILRVVEKEGCFDRQAFSVLAVLGVLVISSSQIWETYRIFGEYRSTSSRVKELDSLGQIGVIGNYWESYKFSLVNPSKVMSTPHDKSDVRNHDRILETVLSNRVFFVRDNWLNSFPDSIQQFDFWFKKKGNEFRTANSVFCEYQLTFHSPLEKGQNLILKGHRFIHNGELLTADSSIYFNTSRLEQYHSLFGPKIGIPRGKYVARFYFNQFSKEELEANLLIDVVHKGGTIIDKAMMLKDAKRVGRYYEIEFKLPKPVFDAEFRFHELKPSSYVLKAIEVEKIK